MFFGFALKYGDNNFGLHGSLVEDDVKYALKYCVDVFGYEKKGRNERCCDLVCLLLVYVYTMMTNALSNVLEIDINARIM